MDIPRSLAALDALPEATVALSPVRDADGRVVFVFAYANRRAGEIAQLAPGELVGLRIREALPAFPKILFAGFIAVLDGGPPLRTNIRYADRLDGRKPFSTRFAVSASRIGDALLLVYDDVGERTRVHAFERRYGAVLEATSDWVSIADGDNNLVYINPAGRAMIGLDPDEDITGRRIGEFSPAWARERVHREALAVARRDGVWRGEGGRLHRDGHEIPTSQVIVARMTPNDTVDFYATIARDMTRERAAEAALRESEERFRVAFEQASIGVSLIDLDGHFVQVNDAYCQIVRRTREELMRLHPAGITHPDDAAMTAYAIDALVNGGDSVFRFEKRYVDALGDPIWVEISASLFRDHDGNPQYLIGMVQDLGERRAAATLQRSMLTTDLPRIDGVELAVRYLPGTRRTEISGDWYDVVPLPDGRVGVVIGDVVGRGIEAAATMSQLRTALRAYAVDGLQPAEVVGKLHRLVDHLGVGLSTTLAYLDFDPFTREVRYVSAGHLPILHVPAGGPSQFLAGARSTPLGAAPVGAEIPQERIVLGPGDAVLLYTDGLVERRDDGIDSRLEQLRTAVAAAPDELPAALEHLTATLVGDDALRQDDVALLALRVASTSDAPFVAQIAPVADELATLRRDLRTWLAGAGAGERESGDVLIAVGEACANAIEHAGATTGSTIEVRAQLVGSEVVLRIVDQGRWRTAAPRSQRGHGLRLMRVLMDGIDIATVRDGTRVELRRRLAAREGARVNGEPRGPLANAAASAGAARLAVTHLRQVTIARLAGEVDLEATVGLRDALAGAVPEDNRGLVVDLTRVAYLDSAGLHLLHDTARTLAARGQSLRVVITPHALIAPLLEIVGMDQAVPVDASVDAAVDALASAPL
jgi:anti-anti-sigma factor